MYTNYVNITTLLHIIIKYRQRSFAVVGLTVWNYALWKLLAPVLCQ